MNTTGKIAAIGLSGAVLGTAIFAWTVFGGEVYFAYLAGAVMRCF